MKIIIILAICTTLLQNCTIKQGSHTKWLRKELIIPSDTSKLKVKNNNTDFNLWNNNNNLKLIVTINGECGSCIEKLKEIQKFMQEIQIINTDISLLLFVYSPISDFYNFEEMNSHIINFNYPIIYDPENLFVIRNKTIPIQLFSMFLCNAENKILVYGDFTKNDKLKQLYLKEIDKNAIPNMIDSPIKQQIIKNNCP